MKTRYWIGLLTVILIICTVLSFPLLISGEDAAYAVITSDGQVLQIVDLSTDCEIQITAENGGQNTVTVKDGRIGVTDANCPDHYCMDRGMCNRGTQIVCLPNRLIIRFTAPQIVDSIAG